VQTVLTLIYTQQLTHSPVKRLTPRGGAPIGAGGSWPHFSRQRGTGEQS